MYQGFLIANYNTGFHTTKEPWLAPQDAFVTLENARCQDGILTKRAGTAQLAQMIHDAAVQTTTVTGLHLHSSRGYKWLLACDTARPNVYDKTSGAMIDISGGSDIFTGRDSELFWFLTHDDKTYMTNNRDGIYSFSGASFDPASPTAVAALDMSLDSGSMTAAHMLFLLNDRFLCYDVVEAGVHRPYRLRYSQALAYGNTPVFTGGFFLDVRTDDKPVTGRKLGRYVYLWHDKSLWVIRPTGDTDIPFAPDRIRGDLGSLTPNVCIPFDRGILTVGQKDLIHFDGYETRKLNLPQLNNILQQFTFLALKYSWGMYDEPNQRIYITFAASGSNLPDRILEYSITDKVFAIHKINAHTLAMYDNSGFIAWDDADAAFFKDGATLAEMPIAGGGANPDKLAAEQDFPVYGGRDGFVYRMFTGSDDNSAAYDFKATSARLNPFKDRGKRCSLASVAVLVDTSATATFDVRLYKNTSTTAYKTQTITCTGSGDKHWETLHAGGEVGDFHQIEYYNSATANIPAIHATWLEMEPAGWLNP